MELNYQSIKAIAIAGVSVVAITVLGVYSLQKDERDMARSALTHAQTTYTESLNRMLGSDGFQKYLDRRQELANELRAKPLDEHGNLYSIEDLREDLDAILGTSKTFLPSPP